MLWNSLEGLRESASHIWMGGEALVAAAREQLVKVLASVTVSGNEQSYGVVLHLGDKAGGEDPGALWPLSNGVSFLGQALHPHGGIVVVDHFALGCQREQSLMHRFQSLAGLGHELPLRGGWQTHTQIDLHSVQSVVGHASAKAQIPQHGTHLRIIFAQPCFLGCWRGQSAAMRRATRANKWLAKCGTFTQGRIRKRVL